MILYRAFSGVELIFHRGQIHKNSKRSEDYWTESYVDKDDQKVNITCVKGLARLFQCVEMFVFILIFANTSLKIHIHINFFLYTLI